MNKRFTIVNIDNFDGDYPDEKFLTATNSEGKSHPISIANEAQAQAIADALNDVYGGTVEYPASRHWVVKPADYKLQPGFEP